MNHSITEIYPTYEEEQTMFINSHLTEPTAPLGFEFDNKWALRPDVAAKHAALADSPLSQGPNWTEPTVKAPFPFAATTVRDATIPYPAQTVPIPGPTGIGSTAFGTAPINHALAGDLDTNVSAATRLKTALFCHEVEGEIELPKPLAFDTGKQWTRALSRFRFLLTVLTILELLKLKLVITRQWWRLVLKKGATDADWDLGYQTLDSLLSTMLAAYHVESMPTVATIAQRRATSKTITTLRTNADKWRI